MAPDVGAICSFDGRARIVTALGAERDIVAHTSPMHLVVEGSWGDGCITISFIGLAGLAGLAGLGRQTLCQVLS